MNRYRNRSRLFVLEQKLLHSKAMDSVHETIRSISTVRVALFVLLTLGSLFAEITADACSTLCLRHNGRIVFGKNYDWTVEDGLLIVNKRGLVHVSDTGVRNGTVPARWISRFGSVTFNQYGRNFPSGGINEAGLVVELMWADGSRYPREDWRPTVDCLEWIQYQLDTAKTVSDIIASDRKIRIHSNIPLHYLVADRDGAVATIEFIGGKLVAHTGKDLPVAALTNDLYQDSLRFLENLHWIPQDGGSRARFARTAERVKNFKGGDPVSYVFDALTNVRSDITQWSIVYEIDNRQVHFRTRSNPQVRTLAMKSLDFSCGTSVLVFDLKDKSFGDIRPHLKAYSKELNLNLIRSSFAQTDFLARTTHAELDRIASLPDSSVCREERVANTISIF
jgi:penicillin V acylase-like amidase (Ntn superfamily)